MVEFLILLIVTIICWVLFFYERKKILNEDTDSLTKFNNHGLNLRVLIIAITGSILTIYSLVKLLT